MTMLMIDIETLDTKATSAVLSVGAVTFTMEGVGHGVGNEYYRILDLAEQFGRGRSVSQDTLLWWMQQEEEARAEAFGLKRTPIKEVLSGLSNFCQGNNIKECWSNGPGFDGMIMGHLYTQNRMETPWKFWNERDVRTLKDFLTGPMISRVGAHNALADCHYQIDVVRAAYKQINS